MTRSNQGISEASQRQDENRHTYEKIDKGNEGNLHRERNLKLKINYTELLKILQF